MKHKIKSRSSKLLYYLLPLYAHAEKNKWKFFREYLSSPLHVNSQTKAAMLDKVAQVLSSANTSDKLLEESLCELILPEDDYQQKDTKSRLRRRLSPLLDDYYEFEALLRYKADKVQVSSNIIGAANALQWDKYFSLIYKKKGETVLDNQAKNASFYLFQMHLEDNYDAYKSRQPSDGVEIKDRYASEQLALDNFYAISLLRIACNMRNRQRLAPEDSTPELPLLGLLLLDIRNDWDTQEELVQVYYLIYMGLKSKADSSYFFALMPLLYARGQSFGKEECRTLFQLANNYCNHLYNAAKSTGKAGEAQLFQRALIALYNFQLKKGIIFQYADGKAYIDHGDFKNLVVNFCIMGELDWVENFITTYSSRILKDFRVTAKNFNLAILHFYRRDFKQAEYLINEVQRDLKASTDHLYALSVKNYFLRILYERGKLGICEWGASNAGKSIRNNKHLPEENQKKSLQFCMYCGALCKAVLEAPGAKTNALHKLQKKIEKGPPTLSIDWLQEKIAEAMAE